MKNKKSKLFFLISMLSFLVVNSFGQAWIKSNEGNSFSLNNLFYHDLKLFFKGLDSNFYALTSHKPDSYWEKRNQGKSELIISKINSKGDISVLTKLNEYVDEPVLKIFNNKYYLLDDYFKVYKKQYYYNCYVYNFNWELESVMKIPELPHQRGFSDFIVNKKGELILLTAPYFIDHKQADFKGCYFIKCSSDGKLVKKVLFEKSYPSSLQISGDAIVFHLNHQKFTYPFFQTDSIFEISSDNELNYTILAKKKFTPKNYAIKEAILFADGQKVIYIDSTNFLAHLGWNSSFKMALIDNQNNRVWTFEPSNRWFFLNPKPLQNGTFLTQIDKRWDSTCLVIFDKTGKQKSIKSFLMNADTRIDRYNFIDFFEVNKNEIWIFYKKESPNRKEEIYYERLLL